MTIICLFLLIIAVRNKVFKKNLIDLVNSQGTFFTDAPIKTCAQ